MPEIVTIPALPLGMLNAYLVIHGREAVLVDCGLPGTEAKVERALTANGLGWPDLRAIILTHGHIDHAGGAREMARHSNAPVHAHEAERPYLTGTPPITRPTGPFGRLFKQTGLIQKPFGAVTVNHWMTGTDVTAAPFWLDAPLRLVPSPGHTPGSLSVLLDDGRVLAGDLLASGILLGGIAFRHLTKQPPFEEDTGQVLTSLQSLLDLGGSQFYLGHGGPVSRRQVEVHMARLRRRRA